MSDGAEWPEHDTVTAEITHDAGPTPADREPTFEVSGTVGEDGPPSSLTIECDQLDHVEVRDGQGEIVFRSDESDVAEFLRLLARYMRGENVN